MPGGGEWRILATKCLGNMKERKMWVLVAAWWTRNGLQFQSTNRVHGRENLWGAGRTNTCETCMLPACGIRQAPHRERVDQVPTCQPGTTKNQLGLRIATQHIATTKASIITSALTALPEHGIKRRPTGPVGGDHASCWWLFTNKAHKCTGKTYSMIDGPRPYLSLCNRSSQPAAR